MTDRERVALLRDHPNRGMEELARQYATLAAGIAGRILQNPRDAEEVASDVLLRLWQNRETLNPDTLRGFVITTARNLAVDRWRQLRRRSEVPLTEWDREPAELLESLVLTKVLAEQIKALSPPDGELFLRHYLLLETARELADRFQMTVPAVRSRLHRLRERLRKEVQL